MIARAPGAHSTRRRRATIALPTLVAVALSIGAASPAFGHGETPPSLAGVEIPPVPGLVSGRAPIVRNRAKAIALGKALFWDIQVGSDGMACATCHFHAGADARVKNQLSPGHARATRLSAATFETTGSAADGGPNYTLRLSDFPFHKLADPASFGSAVLFTTDDVVGSAGTFPGEFRGVGDPASPFDDCSATAHPIFNVEGVGTRQVTSRNAPSVINAVFARRTFWDGRANSTFNGVNALGPRDPDARVWMLRNGRLRRKRLALRNSTLASQAVAPPVDTDEMSCANRTFADIGRKLLRRRPLQFQAVHPDDGVLARNGHASGDGLDTTYTRLIRAAFDRRFWAAPRSRQTLGSPAAGGKAYTQMEANFALFFGLAVQLYQSTLVSDQAPFDSPRDDDNVPTALDAQQRRGLLTFIDLHCHECHGGPTLGGAAVPDENTLATDVDRRPVRSASGPMTLGLVDAGFVNTGVVPGEHDAGVAGTDASGHPLSFTAQYLELLLGRPDGVLDDLAVQSCVMTAPFATSTFGETPFGPDELIVDPAADAACGAPRWAQIPTPAVAAAEIGKPDNGRLATGTNGAFKVPSLRNVELTGPYMHNGGMATLEEVVQFYNRGGNFSSQGKDVQFMFGVGVSDATLADLVAFLRSFTDERVRMEQAPFDHPALPIPDGHPGDEHTVTPGETPGLAATELLLIPAVGASGRDATLGPLRPFAERVQP